MLKKQAKVLKSKQQGNLKKQGKEGQGLSDPRDRNHKSLAIANHNFEVANFSRRNRNEIAVLQVFSESQRFF